MLSVATFPPLHIKRFGQHRLHFNHIIAIEFYGLSLLVGPIINDMSVQILFPLLAVAVSFVSMDVYLKGFDTKAFFASVGKVFQLLHRSIFVNDHHPLTDWRCFSLQLLAGVLSVSSLDCGQSIFYRVICDTLIFVSELFPDIVQFFSSVVVSFRTSRNWLHVDTGCAFHFFPYAFTLFSRDKETSYLERDLFQGVKGEHPLCTQPARRGERVLVCYNL